MAEDKKLVEAITSMDVDFAQWYTDVCKKAELMSYSSVKGCMIFKPAGYAIWENIKNEMDGSRICCYHGIQRVGYLSCDLCIYTVCIHCIMVCRDYAVMHCDVTVKLPHFLPVHEESEPVYPT